jgi:hypothetical protein
MRTVRPGKYPPPTKPSDADVIASVATDKGGVGYVSSEAIVPPTVSVVTVQ